MNRINFHLGWILVLGISSPFFRAHEFLIAPKGFELIYGQENLHLAPPSQWTDQQERVPRAFVLPEFQGKGYATHLVRYVLSEAKRLGAHYCFLESSDSGLGVYQKLGFETLFKNNMY